MKKWYVILILLLSVGVIEAQDSIPPKFTVAGYIKNLQTLNFSSDFSNLVSGNLIHNRLNFKWKPSDKISVITEMRNRIFWGEEYHIPGFSQQLKNELEGFDLQKVWIDQSSFIFHTNIERIYLDVRESNWNLRLGRQRINWGKTTTWNPNDIFNTYNFLDFDYEERSGADGLKFQYLPEENWNAEIAYAYTGGEDGHVAAIKFATNKWNYDFQAIAGIYHNRFTAGTGWAGYIGEAGFKGEIQYFSPSGDSPGNLNLTLGSDYMFEKGWYLDIGGLYNDQGITGPINSWDFSRMDISPLNLMPTRWNFVAGTAKEITPLFIVNAGFLYAPGTDLLIVYPSIQYNLVTNLDLNFVWHSLFAGGNPGFEALGHRIFLRVKWSF